MMEVEADYSFIADPSLEDLSMTKIALSIWSDPDLRDIIKRHLDRGGNTTITYLDELHRKLLEKVSGICFPSLLEKRAENAVFCIGRTILKWLDDSPLYWLEPDFDIRQRIGLIDSITLTSLGCINESKMIEVLIEKHDNKDVKFLMNAFERAVGLCYENVLVKLWAMLPNRIKKLLLASSKVHGKEYFRTRDSKCLSRYWLSVLSEEIPELRKKYTTAFHQKDVMLHQCMLKLSFEHQNANAVQYFWRKLVQKGVIPDAVKLPNSFFTRNPGLFFFLLSQVTEKDVRLNMWRDQMEDQDFFQQIAQFILFRWRLRDFLPHFLRFFRYCRESAFRKCPHFEVISSILLEISHLKSKQAAVMFQDLWSSSSRQVKACFFRSNRDVSKLILDLLLTGNYDLTLSILNDATVEQKGVIINHMLKTRSACTLIIKNDLSSVEKLMIDLSETDSDVAKCKEGAGSLFTRFLCFCSLERWYRQKYMAQKLFHSHGLSETMQWEGSQTVVRWSCSSDEEVKLFKNSLNKVYIVCSLIEYRKLELLDNFLCWCCFSEKLSTVEAERMISFMSSTLISHGFLKDVIRTHRYSLLNKLLDWCCTSREEVKKMKRDITKNLKLTNLFVELQWNSFEQFTYWCYDESQELKKVKDKLSDFRCVYDFIHRILSAGKRSLEKVDQLLIWCLESTEEGVLLRYKCLFVADFQFGLFHFNGLSQSSLAKWLNPPLLQSFISVHRDDLWPNYKVTYRSWFVSHLKNELLLLFANAETTII